MTPLPHGAVGGAAPSAFWRSSRCPCHVPLLALALSGTAAGALLAAHFDEAVMLFSVLFLLSLCAAIWVWRGKRIDGP